MPAGATAMGSVPWQPIGSLSTNGVSPEFMYYLDVAPNSRAIAVIRRRLVTSFGSRCSSRPMFRTRVEPSRWAYRAIRLQELPPKRFPM